MKRKINGGKSRSDSISDRMNYTNPGIVSKWQNRFSKKEPPEPVRAEEPVLALIQKIPVVFQLQRRDNPADFDRMAFVIRACSKDTDKPSINILHVEQTRTGSRLVATDGRRLHFSEIPKKIKSGEYKPVMTKETISLINPDKEIRFPNWPKVVPEQTTRRGVIHLENAGFCKDQKQTEKLTLAFNSFVRQTGETINLRYLEDLTKKSWTVYSQAEKGKAVILREYGAEESVYAVLMPIPWKEVETVAMAA
jgi:hypothetical protein